MFDKILSLGDVLNTNVNSNINSLFNVVTDTDKINDDVTVIDNEWVKSRFITPDSDLETVDRNNRYWTTASWKFTDTSLGGNIGINPRPQFTRYCDIKGGHRIMKADVAVSHTTGNHGMGRYYSEAIDDNAQTVFMEFGVPRFNNLIDFFLRAIDYVDSSIANTGRVPLGYTIATGVGGFVMLAAFPLITLTIWAAKLVSKVLIGNSNFNYYYLEPTMHTYWGTVNTLVTNLATELGILIPDLQPDPNGAGKLGVNVKLDENDMKEIRKLLPGLISDNNYIDVFAIATRAQTIANHQLLKERDDFENGSPDMIKDYIGYLKKEQSTYELGSPGSSFIDELDQRLSFSNYLKVITSKGSIFGDNATDNSKYEENDPKNMVQPKQPGGVAEFTKDKDGSFKIDNDKKKPYLESLADAIDSSTRMGGLHAAFYVDYVGSVSESFSNSVGNISVGDNIKSVAAGARNIKFDMAGGNVIPGTDEIMKQAKGVIAGTLDSITYGLSSVIQTMTGGGYVDLPKKWEDSDMSLPQISYNMTLISPYGNPISQLQNIYIPLAMLLAGTLPLSTGKSSYTSPFICSLYSKGIQNIKLGMITSLSISRGTSNLGFNKQRRPLAIEVSFTVTDFSTLVTAPINSSIFNIFNVSLEDDTPLSNYIATLAARDLLTTKYVIPKLKLKASRLMMNFEQSISSSSWGLRIGEKLSNVIGGVVSNHSLTLSHQN